MKKTIWSSLVAMLTLIPMAANAQDDDTIVIEKETLSVKFTQPEIKYKDKKRFIKDGKSTQFSVNAKYPLMAKALERFATKFFFRDTISATFGEAVDRYTSTLGDIDQNGIGLADATEKYEMNCFSKAEELLYSYSLSYEKVADGKKRSNKRFVIYDATKERILQLEDVVNAHLADSIHADAGKSFISIFSSGGSLTNISYKKQKEQKEINLFFKRDKDKFTLSFYEMLTAANKKKSEEIARRIANGEVVGEVDEMPEFSGGQEALFKFINEKLRYPKEAEEHGIQGRVICNFVVEKDGSITDVKVQRSVDPLLGAEAIRVLKTMPKWKLGRHGGKPARVYYTVPVSFRLK